MLIAQITDHHVGGEANDFYRLNTRLALRRAIEQVNALRPLPDACLVTGDIVESGKPADYLEARAELDALKMPWYPIPGNHDERGAFLTAFEDRLPPKEDRLEGFGQYAIDTHPLRLIGLDTVVPGKSHGLLCERRLAWLETVLAKKADTPTLLMMHHPPFATLMPAADGLGLENAPAFSELVSRHQQIEAIVCGHVHRAIHGCVAHAPASISPGTAHQVYLALNADDPIAFTHEPPGFQLHGWNGRGTWTTHTIQIGTFPGPFAYH